MSTVHKPCQLRFLCDGGWATKKRTWSAGAGLEGEAGTHLQSLEVLGSATGKTKRKKKRCTCCICTVHWRHLWSFFAQSPTSVLVKFATWCLDSTPMVSTLSISFGMTGNSPCQIYNFAEYKTTPQALGSVASHPILTVAARGSD